MCYKMTPTNGTQRQDGNNPPDKLKRRARYAVLWQEDMKAMRRPRGPKALARITGWSVNTIKSDIRRMDKEAQKTAKETTTPQNPAPPPPIPQQGVQENSVIASPPLGLHPPGPVHGAVQSGVDMKWDSDLARVARIVTAAFSQTLRGEVQCECGRRHPVIQDPALALRLASAFSRLYQAKMGGDRVSVFMALNQPPPAVKEVDVRDVIATLMAHDTGPVCILCGAPRGGGRVIDVEPKDDGGGGGK
ncbi:MAG: hypothetical protein KAV87_19495 [Desulfobacteraceae bacterium]|nr:hypothetical protein [Desulfobacteraceae bacterium]